MSKRYEMVEFGTNIDDIETALEKIHLKMRDISEKRGLESNSPEYIAKGEQL